MPVVQFGSVNTAALQIPGVLVQVIPPAYQYLNGVATNILGICGTATWGPVNSPVVGSTPAQLAAIMGQPQVRKYDLMTHVSTAALQGASNFRCVRVTDGTDTAASVVALTNCITFNSKYTGSFGNGITVNLAVGSQINSWKVTVSAPGLVPETFDNIGGGATPLSGNALWVAIATAINSGANVLRPASYIITAVAGSGTTTPATASYSLTGGTDGASGVTGNTLLGSDTVIPRTGMYALRNSGAAVVILSDCDSSATWSTQVSYGLSEGSYMMLVGPAGDTIANATATIDSAGVDSYAAKLLFGDWCYWDDPANGIRLVSPQGFVGGLISNLAPNLSALNQPLLGIVGTQKTYASQVYAAADLALLEQAGIDCIINPSVGGNYYSCFNGHSTSSNSVIRQDSYTRMVFFIAFTINAGSGQFVGKPNTPTLKTNAKAVLSAYFDNLWTNGYIGNPNDNTAVPYSIDLGSDNNPIPREALGYLQADIQVEFYPIVEDFLLNLTAGASVQIASTNTTLFSAAASST